MLISEHLTERGYQVEVANSGEEALSVLERGHDRIALAVVDFRMPGMFGPKLLRVLEERHPGLPAILMSGFGVRVWELDSYPWRVGLLAKPFCLAELEALVRAVLGSPDR